MSWVLVVAGFAALIMVHEGGHFVVAKLTGMRVERFFLFFPPKLVSFRRGETEYGIGMIPLGGFVKITGMNPEELEAAERGENVEHKPGLLEQLEGADSGKDTPQPIEGDGPVDPDVIERAYYNQPVWKRIAVIAAGPAVNIVLAFILLTVIYLSLPVPKAIVVDTVQAGTPAAPWAAVGGAPLLSFLVALAGTTLAWALLAGERGTAPAGARLPRLLLALVLVLALADAVRGMKEKLSQEPKEIATRVASADSVDNQLEVKGSTTENK